MTEVSDPYIAILKREATRPLIYQPGIFPTRYFEMLSRLEIQIEFARLNADDPRMHDQLFVKLVRYVSFLEMLSPIKSSSDASSREYSDKLRLARSFIEEAEKVKESIVERVQDERRLKAEEAARISAAIDKSPHFPNASAPIAPTSATSSVDVSAPTQSSASNELVHPWEYPEKPPPPTIDSFCPEPQLETRKEDRTYRMAGDLEKRFLQAAWSNTQKGIETVGILVGDMKGNDIVLNAILLPPQKGSHNTCEALDEIQVSAWQIEHGRISVGWIHTHPTQDAFLSSIDLHTHLSYQSLQPEAIALVCAPTDQNVRFGKFRITDYGMEYLKTCNKTVGFHPHDDATSILFEDVQISVDEKMKLELVDFRV